jgi:hypothetical protein
MVGGGREEATVEVKRKRERGLMVIEAVTWLAGGDEAESIFSRRLTKRRRLLLSLNCFTMTRLPSLPFLVFYFQLHLTLSVVLFNFFPPPRRRHIDIKK